MWPANPALPEKKETIGGTSSLAAPRRDAAADDGTDTRAANGNLSPADLSPRFGDEAADRDGEKLLPNPPVTSSLLDLLAIDNTVPFNALPKFSGSSRPRSPRTSCTTCSG